MEPEILRAEEESLIEIMFILRECAKDLISKGYSHWNSAYPSFVTISEDIKKGNLYLLRNNGGTIGVITLNDEQDSSYDQLKWTSNSNALIVNRLAIHPFFQKKGFAKILMAFAADFAKKEGYKSIRLDTFAGNKDTLHFFERCGFSKVGETALSKDLNIYACFEKEL
ncbi:GNAT family N-acetyltransferase [Williamwhitmania taraxaci]|uniref:Acetyltransferase (GNAT) family protein n=1 Tax=Williamwhitmania taraxaci TaxID=1640674 RepID=A0A1G6GRJ3_9BACT|nr:GNAT family N-acetyltransferase [Williamwhitmania taraxaci]SDB84355.1 Acetyltransferase (GNAT) family protein [Williamwhitmania taraxaci]